jgi:hypothetical protein
MLVNDSVLSRSSLGLLWVVTKLLTGLLLFGYLSAAAFAQVPVAIAPTPRLVFTDLKGNVLAGGKLYTYQAGTTTLQNTYADSTGTFQNLDPIPLDAAGVASNGTGIETQIWLNNQAFKFCAYNSLNVQQWCVDNIASYFALLNTANTWSQTQTFTQPIVITPTDNQIILGTAPNQTTLDAPPPTGNIALHFPNTTDTIVGRATTDTLTNKTLTSPTVNGGTFSTPTINGAVVVNSPGTYALIANANPTGTTTSTLTKLINSTAQATIATTSDLTGIIGITVSGAGASGNAVVQESGLANCLFDGATTAGDYVQVSISVAGDCHDSGSATYPLKNQIIGRVMTTNGGAGTYQVLLFSPDIEGSSANSIGITVANNGAGTTLNTLTKLTSAPSQAVMTGTGDTGGIVGITTSGAGTTGSAVIAQVGLIACQFDGATTAGDYVQNSITVNGDCHDAGANYPGGGQVVGRVMSTNIGAGAYTIDLFPPEIRSPVSILQHATTTTIVNGTIPNSNTIVFSKAVTMPATGCPCRVLASYALYITTTNAGVQAAMVSDGTNNWAGSVSNETGSVATIGVGQNGTGTSPVTYANNAAVTFTVVAASTAAGSATVNSGVGASLTGAPASQLILDVFSSN